MTTQATTATAAALTLQDVSAGYGRFNVIEGLNLQVAPGEALGLVGPNGVGKTTVMRAIMGTIKHRAGVIKVGETDIASMPTRKIARGLAALVPEGRRLFSELSVEDNLRLGGLHLRSRPDEIERLLASVFESFPYSSATVGAPRRHSAAVSSRWSRSGAC